MAEQKIYRAETGVAIDDCFANHVHHCETCKTFDVTKPASVALLCLEGSILWKRENGVKVTKEHEVKSDKIVSKAELKTLMRYK